MGRRGRPAANPLDGIGIFSGGTDPVLDDAGLPSEIADAAGSLEPPSAGAPRTPPTPASESRLSGANLRAQPSTTEVSFQASDEAFKELAKRTAQLNEGKLSFWTRSYGYDPKASHRFKVVIPGMALEDARLTGNGDSYADKPDKDAGLVWYAKTVTKPGFSFETEFENSYQNDYRKFPNQPAINSPSYKRVNMTLIDPTYPNATRKLLRLFRRAGLNDNKARGVVQRKYGGDSVKALFATVGNVKIMQLDPDGNPLETWTLYEAYPIEIDFGTLDYSSDSLVEIKVVWAYTRFDVEMPAYGAEDAFRYYKDDLTGQAQLKQAVEDAESVCREKWKENALGKTWPQYKKKFCPGAAGGDSTAGAGVAAARTDPLEGYNPAENPDVEAFLAELAEKEEVTGEPLMTPSGNNDQLTGGSGDPFG